MQNHCGFFSYCLEKYHKKNVIVLIDEYDVPLENACFEGFYDKMITFIRSLFESVLKTNPYLELAVITGCLRISKESIFTGLNNLKILSIQQMPYAGCFGFMEDEVKEMLVYYELSDKFEEVQAWYDGYLKKCGERKVDGYHQLLRLCRKLLLWISSRSVKILRQVRDFI